MSSDQPNDKRDRYQDIQNRDTTGTREAVLNTLDDKASRKAYRDTLDTEAFVRETLKEAQEAIVGYSDADPLELLLDVHEVLWNDDDRQQAMYQRMERQAAVRWRELNRLQQQGRLARPEEWHAVLSDAAKAMNFTNAVTDPSQYAPVTMEHIDGASKHDDTTGTIPAEEDIQRVGRLRVPADSRMPLEERAAEIPHDSCEHICIVAMPRQGKDSTGATIAGNLKDEHRYKWVSLLDDGRNELPMIATPADEEAVIQSLEQVGSSPKAYDTTVWVPAMPGLPDRLPGNHVPFTIGIETLTPDLVLRLAGITSISTNTERRIRRALEQTRQRSGSVEELTNRLEDQSDEVEATITISEVADEDNEDAAVGEDAVREISYTMPEDEAMRDAAQALAQYAADGFIADAGTETNLNIEEVLQDRSRVAALNCNFLRAGDQGLKYLIMDLWAQLIFKRKGSNARLPRVALEVRELKNVAPSNLGNARYTTEKKAMRQTLYDIASQGGSRGINLIGSTQKYNDVYKAIRQNMQTKIALKNDEGEISTLADSYSLDKDQQERIAEFSKGQGMLIEPGDRHYPIQWRGARCGLGDKDRDWLDRYGIAWGARVRERKNDRWRSRFEGTEWWVDVNDSEVRFVEDGGIPPISKDYSAWYLLDRDFPPRIGPEDVDEDIIETVLERRRDYEIPSDLSLQPTRTLGTREETLRDPEEAEQERLEERFEEHDVPTVLYPWAKTTAEKRERMRKVIRAVKRHDSLSTQTDIERAVNGDPSRSTFANYLPDNDALGACIVKDADSGCYEVTPIGQQALDIDWRTVAGED